MTALPDGSLSALKLENPVAVEANCRVAELDFSATVTYTVTESYTFHNTAAEK